MLAAFVPANEAGGRSLKSSFTQLIITPYQKSFFFFERTGCTYTSSGAPWLWEEARLGSGPSQTCVRAHQPGQTCVEGLAIGPGLVRARLRIDGAVPGPKNLARAGPVGCPWNVMGMLWDPGCLNTFKASWGGICIACDVHFEGLCKLFFACLFYTFVIFSVWLKWCFHSILLVLHSVWCFTYIM